MKESLQAGLNQSVRIEIDEPRTISFVGDVLVYATPSLIYDMEVACRNLILEHTDEGEDSVGTRVAMDHMGATLCGMWVEITVEVTEVKGKLINFEFTAKDALEQVAKGQHSRFVVNTASTAERLKAKAAKANS